MADIKMIVLLVLAFSLSATAENEDMLMTNYQIHVFNDVPLLSPFNDVPTLYLHCKSNERDIGEKAMYVSDDYTWWTRSRWVKVYSCNARWTKGKQMVFDAFQANRDSVRCKKYQNSCLWSVKSDGIYFSNDNSTWTNEYPW